MQIPSDFYTVLKIILLPPEDAAKFFEKSPSFDKAEALLTEMLSDFPADETAKEVRTTPVSRHTDRAGCVAHH